MQFYTVKQVAEILNTNEETVRRWIRTGKLEAIQNSKKEGNLISADALNKFVKETPKYNETLLKSTFGVSAIMGALLGGVVAFIDKNKKKKVTQQDIERVINKKIELHQKNIDKKTSALKQLEKEIEEEKSELEKYKYALENLDLQKMAIEINKEEK